MPQQPYRYWIGPWVWNDAAGFSSYTAPSGTFARVDLRPIPQQSVASNGNGTGHGFFVTESNVNLGADYDLLGEGFVTAIHTDPSMASAWQNKFGIVPLGDFLSDYLAYTLTDASDPTGDNGPKPLVPGTPPPGPPPEGVIDLAGHSPIWRRTYHFDKPNSRWTQQVRNLWRLDLERIAQQNDSLWRKVLGAEKQKHGQRWDDPDEVHLMPPGLVGRGPANPGDPLSKRRYAMRPETTLIETWPNNAADIEATAQDYGWETLNLANWKQTLQVSGGECYCDAASAGFFHYARCTTALSSSDHYSESPFTVSANYATDVCVRMNGSGAGTAYTFDFYYNNSRRLLKWVAEANTVLSTTAMTGGVSAVTARCQVNGSGLTGSLSGYGDITATDTAITGNLYAGVGANYQTTVTDAKLGAVTMADLAAATATSSNLLLLGVG